MLTAIGPQYDSHQLPVIETTIDTAIKAPICMCVCVARNTGHCGLAKSTAVAPGKSCYTKKRLAADFHAA